MTAGARVLVLAWACAALGACATPATTEQRTPAAASARFEPRTEPSTLRYTFALDAELSVIDARMCVRGQPPRALALGMREAHALLERVAIEGRAGVRELSTEALPIELPGMQDGDCVAYRLRLGAHARGGFTLTRAGDALMTNTALWLARPVDHERFGTAHARFELAEGMRASLPFRRDGDDYVLEPSAFAYYGYAAFGRFEHESIDAAGARFELALLPGLSPAARPHLRTWIVRAAEAVSTLYGRMPRERVQLVVLPRATGGGPVPFAMVTRGGGASVGALLDRDFEPSELERDWVLVHELCHLVHPFVRRGDAWLSEGLATYYQEVLRVRAGLLPEADAWRRLLEGSRKAAALTRSVAAESAEMHSTHAYVPVYWAGAAFALRADVELRARTGGRMTLDRVLAELAACCSRELRSVPADELLARMDGIAGMPVFSELAQRDVHGPSFPALDPLYARLGLGERGAPLDAAGEGGEIRRAIMRDARLQGPRPDGTRAP